MLNKKSEKKDLCIMGSCTSCNQNENQTENGEYVTHLVLLCRNGKNIEIVLKF